MIRDQAAKPVELICQEKKRGEENKKKEVKNVSVDRNCLCRYSVKFISNICTQNVREYSATVVSVR